jgi:hypothetical protein
VAASCKITTVGARAPCWIVVDASTAADLLAALAGVAKVSLSTEAPATPTVASPAARLNAFRRLSPCVEPLSLFNACPSLIGTREIGYAWLVAAVK